MSATEIPEIYLQPGEWKLVCTPAVLKTVLGSCVGITFRVARLGVGAMCHPMLPNYASRPRLHAGPVAVGRYVDAVIRKLAARLDKLSACRSEVEVKIFGGADVLATVRKETTVGAMNSDTALRILAEEGFNIAASHLGGDRGVFIEFDTCTGEVLLRRLNHMDAATLART